MRVSRLKTILLLSTFVLTLFSIPITVRADDNDDADDYDVKARVARISMLDGDVSLKRNDNNDWEAAKVNYPLVEGDTVTTAANSNLEIQVDARNFIRLSSNSVLRIITLRDEGIAISVVEGTVTVRLANFDRKRGYFEVDAPKSTLAAEKNGLYRIDVPKNGRVRLTVREGGNARIYSDTSGFSLRDGRAAELVVDGENAGDWDLMAAAPPDAIDNWVADRERYLAQRFKYDAKYYDEYVWGGEDLDAYGDWIKTDDYGWIWRPFPSAISVYSNWVPYRYGQWTWCPPYGWTWIGYEPWGWAPYHYGRWVYFNGYWAWCPRSQFYRNRSWWRPALVAFVFDFSFGDNVCWYPLNYYQRDPHSRRYRHDDRRDRDRHPGYGGGRDSNDRRRHDGHENWRGVTRTPRRDFGNPDRRPQVVEEPVARRVADSDPERGDLPRRGGWGRVPMVNVPERPTGAGERTPGVALDDDLRRNRVFRGREPRTDRPEQPNNSTPAANTSAPVANTETQPTGAVERPEPRVRRGEPRPERPRTREGSENAGGGGSSPPQANENPPRNEQPAPVTEPPRETPRVERRERGEPVVRPESGSESRPRFEPRTEPRSEPRSEPRESRPETRSESPRSEPRNESPRSESPRTESPRSEPRHESPRSESPRSESPRSESPRSESPRSEPRHESPRSESPRSESPRSESPRSEPSRSESPRSEAPRSEPSRSESPRSESPRSESPRSDPDSSRPKPDKPMF
jgi:hypothetical protein